MPRLTIGKMMIGIAISGLLMALAMFVGEPRRPNKVIDMIELLAQPRKVLGWDSTGLILDNNKKLALPGIRTISIHSRAMKIGTFRGVEVTPTGQVIGLVRVYHLSLCGQAPFINHLARVNLADMMKILGEDPQYTPTVPAPAYVMPMNVDDGLSMEEYLQIQQIAANAVAAVPPATKSPDHRGSDHRD